MKNIKFLMLFVISMLLATSILGCNFMNQKQKAEPLVLEWDLSKSHTITDVGWSSDITGDFYTRHDDILMTLVLPGGKIFKERIVAFDVYRRDRETISSIKLQTPNKTADEAYQDAKRLIDYWNLDNKNLDEWYRNRKQEISEIDHRFESIRNDTNPALAVRILNSFDDEKPWFISFEISFNSPE